MEVVTNLDGSYIVNFAGQSYTVLANIEQSGDKTNIITIIDGVKTQASIVTVGNSLHLFTAVRYLSYIFMPPHIAIYLCVCACVWVM
jgi:hypothetical protein